MKNQLLHKILILLEIAVICSGSQVSIYEIQFTEQAGDGTYPSPLLGQTVTTGGIVTAVDYSGGRYFISSPEGGAWSGLYIYDNNYGPALGDSILVTGLVYEYHGFSELKDLSKFEIRNRGNELPAPTVITTNELASLEAYESVLVQVNSVEMVSEFDVWDEWRIDDGSGPCIVSNGMYNFAELEVDIPPSYPLASVTGVISYSWSEFRLHPRDLADIKSEETAGIVSVGSKTVYGFSDIVVPLQMFLFGGETEISSFSLSLDYDERTVAFASTLSSGTLSENGQIVHDPSSGSITITFSGNASLNNVGTLFNIKFHALYEGRTPLKLHSVIVNDIPITYTSSGELTVFAESFPIADTLTVIQRPLLNIPAIATPGDTLEVITVAHGSTEAWAAELLHSGHTLILDEIGSDYDFNLDRWLLKFRIPEPEFFELYDLRITASGIDDTTRNSVRLIERFKEDFSFVHITDTHLATHLFYDDSASITDTSEIVDLRVVIEDINLINPEFVLLTGDLINEGELEDFENRRNFSKAINLLNELDVPVYIVSGNHDLGGWTATPPPDGTARRNWWRFFGWKWLDKSMESGGPFTQDYSFDYGLTHFIGMESYINYDGWRADIYGSESFIPTQLEWLNAELGNTGSDRLKVIFYHHDFSNRIDLNALGIDMALWGHTHHSSGDIHAHPYNLSTGSTSDGNSRYRVIRVNNGQLQPEETVYANWPSDNLSINFSQPNDGLSESVRVIVNNNHNLIFPDARLKILMPSGDHTYNVVGGELEQVVTTGAIDRCYITLDIPDSSSSEVIVTTSPALDLADNYLPEKLFLYPSHPNPFNPATSIEYDVPEHTKVQLRIFGVDGRLIKTLDGGVKTAGHYSVVWDGTNEAGVQVGSGVYLCNLSTILHSETRKLTLIK